MRHTAIPDFIDQNRDLATARCHLQNIREFRPCRRYSYPAGTPIPRVSPVTPDKLPFDASLLLPNAAFAALGLQRKVIRCYDKCNSNFNRTLFKNW